MTAAMTKPAAKTAEPDEAAGKGSGKKKLVLIVMVLLVAAAAGAYFFLFSGSGKAAPTPGAVVTLDPVAVNLAGGGYLKVGIALQLTSTAGEKVDGAKAQDLVISTYSLAKPQDVNGARDAMKAALQKKIIAAYDGKVMGIYFTQYVTQ